MHTMPPGKSKHLLIEDLLTANKYGEIVKMSKRAEAGP